MKSITLLAILALASFHQSLLPASAADQETGDKETLFNNAKAFVDVFEKGDAKAVAAFWAEDGDYVDLNGRRLQGRPAIENAFKDFFAVLGNWPAIVRDNRPARLVANAVRD